MRMVFSSWSLENPEVATSRLTEHANKRHLASQMDLERRSYAVYPTALAEFGPRSKVLITASASITCHACAGFVGAYWFELSGGKWRLVKRHDIAALHGFFGDAGEVSQVGLANGRVGIAVKEGSVWGGLANDWLSIYEVDQHGLHSLLKLLPIDADSTGAYYACDEVLKQPPSIAVRRAEEKGEDLCMSIQSDWHVKPSKTTPGDIEMHFIAHKQQRALVANVGTPSQGAAEGLMDPALFDATHVRNEYSARYRYRNGHYVLVAGMNPVKAF